MTRSFPVRPPVPLIASAVVYGALLVGCGDSPIEASSADFAFDARNRIVDLGANERLFTAEFLIHAVGRVIPSDIATVTVAWPNGEAVTQGPPVLDWRGRDTPVATLTDSNRNVPLPNGIYDVTVTLADDVSVSLSEDLQFTDLGPASDLTLGQDADGWTLDWAGPMEQHTYRVDFWRQIDAGDEFEFDHTVASGGGLGSPEITVERPYPEFVEPGGSFQLVLVVENDHNTRIQEVSGERPGGP